ncbi:MAG: cbb3-type cytochrome c oxidase subunit I, partial [Pseudomonadota bacterium]
MRFQSPFILTALGTFIAFVLVGVAQDAAFAQHMTVLAIVLFIATLVLARRVEFAPAGQTLAAEGHDQGVYMDEVIRYGVLATAFWGVVGFLVGVVAAAQLAWPELNVQPYFNFGRIRPLHTSAVIFAFGGSALIATSFYIVQRTCRARLWGGNLAWFVFWGYQLFIVMAATGYLLGITQSKEYAEPEWYVDLWLTLVWVAYLAVFLGTIVRRTEPHIYVANWFFLAFIVTVAMLHVVNGLSMPVSLLGAKSYSAFGGVQDALTQWWYGHNAVGFFLTAGFLGMMYYFV